MRIDVDAVCRALLDEGATESDLDEQVLRLCRRLYGLDEEGPAAAVLRVIRHEAERSGGTRLAAVRRLSQVQATIQLTSQAYGSPDEAPPGVRERFRRTMSGQEPAVTHRSVRRTWTPADGEPPPEVIEAAQQAVGEDVAIRIGNRRIGGRRRWLRRILVALVILLIVIAPAIIKLVRVLHEGGPGSMRRGLAELEADYRKSPGLETGMRLGRAYGRKLNYVRAMQGIGSIAAGWGDLAAEADPEVAERIADMERWTGFAANQDELLDTAQKGEAVVREVLGRDDPGPADEATLQLMLGSFVLRRGRTDEAQEASDRAARLDAADVRPHMLNAQICEVTRDFRRGIEEDEAALGKLDAWLRRSGGDTRDAVWLASAVPVADDAPGSGDADDVARPLRTYLEMHILLLKTLQNVEAALPSAPDPVRDLGRRVPSPPGR